jgi:hypothetical protein
MTREFKIIENDNYILAVSDGDVDKYFFDETKNIVLNKVFLSSVPKSHSVLNVEGYIPKNDAPKLESVPYLPSVVIVGDNEKLVKEYIQELIDCGSVMESERTWIMPICHQILIKIKTMMFNEDDLRKAFQAGQLDKVNNWYGGDFTQYFQSLKQPKTPKWFVAETETLRQRPTDIRNHIYDNTYLSLKTTTNSQGKEVLVGTYKMV